MKIRYLANPYSVHVRQWIGVTDAAHSVEIFTIEEWREEAVLGDNVTCHFPLPSWMSRAPKFVKYAWLGLYVRLFCPADACFHAHNSSGYGLSALISGRKYLLTTYGSEIFSADQKSAFYRRMITAVLRRAAHITATSAAMVDELTTKFRLAPERISLFSLGVPQRFIDIPLDRQVPVDPTGPVWFVNRRILPLYGTDAIVAAFQRFVGSGGRGRLILLRGDASGSYYEAVRESVRGTPEIRLIAELLTQKEMATMLDRADFIISVPESDQLSSSILEGMARGCVPILRDLDSYRELRDYALTYRFSGADVAHVLDTIFAETSAMSVRDLKAASAIARQAALEKYSAASAFRIYQALIARYLQPGQ